MIATVALSPSTGGTHGETAVSADAFLVSMRTDSRMSPGEQRLSSTAVNNLSALLADRTSAPLDRLDYSLSDQQGGHDLKHLLLQKSDGSFYLALWREFGGQAPNVAPVSVSFNEPVTTATTIIPELSTRAQNTFDDPQTVDVPVTVIVIIIEIIPAEPDGDGDGSPTTPSTSPSSPPSAIDTPSPSTSPSTSPIADPTSSSGPDVPLIPVTSDSPVVVSGSPSSEPSSPAPTTSEPTTPAPSTSTDPGATTADMPSAGVYRGGGSFGANQMSGYQAFTGIPTPYALDFAANDTLDNLAWPSWMSDAWRNSGQTVVLGGSLALPGDRNRSFRGVTWSWSDAASGALDASWALEGARLVASNQANAVLRGNHEFNGGWFPWRVNNGEQADFIKAWQRWVTVLRAVPGQHFTFDWNPTIGQEALQSPETAYPGDAYVSRIALDVYDGYYGAGFSPGSAQPSAADRDAVWNKILNGPRGLVFWKNFATAHAKHMSFPEWGLRNWTENDGKVHGGGDDAAFIQRMAAIFTDPSYHVDYQAFWEDPTNGGRGVYDPDSGRAVPVPNARAAYLTYIAGR